MKDALARFIAGKLNKEQKKEMLDKFYEKNKHRPDVDKLMEDMNRALEYDKEED